jgi:hypothetical protein
MKHRHNLVRAVAVFAVYVGFGLAQAPQPQAAPAVLTVAGDVSSRLQLKAEILSKMPRETVSVQQEDGTKVEYEGVSLREVLLPARRSARNCAERL